MNNKYVETVKSLNVQNLQWSNFLKRHMILSDGEAFEIMDKCFNAGIEGDDVIEVIREYENTIAAQIVFRNFLNGDLNLKMVDKEMLWSSK